MQAVQNRTGCAVEARPVDETAEMEQGQRSVIFKRHSWRAENAGNRNPGTGRSPQNGSSGSILARGYSRTGHQKTSQLKLGGFFFCS